MSQEKVLRLYADGVFDNFHIGHANMFKQCRDAFPGQKVWLIAGVCSQRDILLRKGPTISSQKERYQMVRQCKWVDEVYEGAPWNLTEQFIIEMKIDFVCHDDVPYKTIQSNDAYYIPKKMGKFKATQRTEGISTTDVVSKILRDKETYYYRNMDRGATKEQLGLSIGMFWFYKLKKIVCPPRRERLVEEEAKKQQ